MIWKAENRNNNIFQYKHKYFFLNNKTCTTETVFFKDKLIYARK